MISISGQNYPITQQLVKGEVLSQTTKLQSAVSIKDLNSKGGLIEFNHSNWYFLINGKIYLSHILHVYFKHILSHSVSGITHVFLTTFLNLFSVLREPEGNKGLPFGLRSLLPFEQNTVSINFLNPEIYQKKNIK